MAFGTRHKFVDLSIQARLAEGAAQAAELLKGLQTIAPASRLLRLMTGRELQLLVCGEADVDLAVLRKHTKYGHGCAENQRHIKYLWEVLEGFTAEERRLFLTFVWSRNRLPLTEQDWGETKMTVHELNTSNLRGPADQHFPVTHTCFFSIEWPQYSSVNMAREKLLYAIKNCRSIDNDATAEARSNMGMG